MANAGKPCLPFRILERFPKLCLAILCNFLLSFWIATCILHLKGHDIITLQMDKFPIRMESSIAQRRAHALETWFYYSPTPYFNRDLPNRIDTDRQFINHYKIDLYYNVKENILTMKHLIGIKNLEDEISALVGYKEAFNNPLSLVPHLIKNVSKPDRSNRNDSVTTILAAMLNESSPETKKLLKYALPPSFKFDSKSKVYHSHLLRSFIFPTTNHYYSYKTQGYRNFRDDVLRPFLSNQSRGQTGVDDFEFRYWGQDLQWEDLADQAKHDTKYVIGAIIFLVVILFLHTQSFILTVTSIFGILSSVVAGNLVYRFIFDYRYLGQFHCVSLFVVLGIGIDDVFVLFDVWRDSFDPSYPPPVSLAHRISQVYRKSALPMFTTSFTSALAFFVNMFCDVPMVYTFGLFTGLVIICNYLMVITFLPCVLINQLVFYDWIKKSKSCNEMWHYVCIPSWAKDFSESNEEKARARWMARFFGDYFFPVIQVKKVAVSLLIVVLLISVFLMWWATMLEPSKTAVLRWFSRGTNYYQADLFDREMRQSAPIKVDLVWGLKLENRSMCHKHALECTKTKTRFDDRLDLNLWQAQLALLDFCKRLSESDELAKKLRIKRVKGKNLVKCFLQDMNQDMLYQKDPRVYNCTDGKALDLTVPIGQVKMSRLVSCRPDIYRSEYFVQKVGLDRWFDRNIETVIYYWMKYTKLGKNIPADSRMRSYSMFDVALEYAKVPRVLTFSRQSPSFLISYLMSTSNFPGRIGVIHLDATLNITPTSDDYSTGLSMKRNWERFMQENNAKFPLGLRGGFPCMATRAPRSPLSVWEWFEIQEALWNNARAGITLGLFGVALPILLLSTRNVFLIFSGVTCLVFVMNGVMAMSQLMGWPVGVSESINFCLSTGLSVDYVIHFLEVYHASSATTRKERVHDMLSRMGGAVSSGAVTTVGATSFLFASNILFFRQFGAFMAAALGFSYLYSLFLLTPFLVLFGPEGRTGSLDALISRMFLKIKSRLMEQMKESTQPVTYEPKN